jgi:hypothetical protein
MSGEARFRLGPVRLEVEHATPPPAGGPTLRILRAADGMQLLRFDCFAHQAHWHLDPDGRDEVTQLPLAIESLDWTVAELRRDLAGYLAKAGLTEPLPDATETLARVEAALRNPPARLDRLSEAVLRQRTGEKWHEYPPDVLALWVADMDYPVAEPIRRRLSARSTSATRATRCTRSRRGCPRSSPSARRAATAGRSSRGASS